MLRVAVASSGSTVDRIIPGCFEESACLLIMDADTDTVLHVVEGTGGNPVSQSLFFAQKVVDFDCEAILCGELEKEAFALLAEENCVTRYLAAGFSALDSIHRMNDYALPLIVDFIGGTGCPDNNPANCDHDCPQDEACDGDCDTCDSSGVMDH